VATLELADKFVGQAAHKELVLRVQWPVWWPRKSRKLVAYLRGATEARSGGPTPDPAGRPRASCQCLISQTHDGTAGQVKVVIPDIPWPASGLIYIHILESGLGIELARIEVGLLDPLGARKLLLANLRVEDVRLWTRSEARCQLGNRIPASAHSVVAELRLANCPLGEFAPPAEEEIAVRLVSENRTHELERGTVTFCSGRVVWRSRPLQVHGTDLFSRAGNYAFEFDLGGREIARAPFRLLRDAELVGQLRVTGIETEAETRNGELVPGLRTLRWEEHQAFRPAIDLQVGVLAPNTLVKCIARVLQGTTVLSREEFLLRLDHGTKHLKLKRLELRTLGLRAQPRPTRLVVSICIGGEVKGSAQVLVLPPERITNFEGQLTFEAAELPFDPAEYEQIAQRLGLEDRGARQRGFWGWLRHQVMRLQDTPEDTRQTTDTSSESSVPFDLS
jgi:hypothetical protein